ncbi:DUF1059 domain-containing protein [Streptomyces sp. NPDC004327]|uniref:DUF1059 domain-containing protein n=1 Tax=unclassified Streptomyces TaxID=2593676 RepID=UPI00367F32E3
MTRKSTDCRDFPSVSNCTMYMAGEEDELLKAAVAHVIAVHGHTDSPQLREEVKASMKDPVPGS